MLFWSALLLVSTLLSPTFGAECKQGENCRLPDCFCPTLKHPSIPELDIPQVVYFGFDDAVQPQVSGYYDQLFTTDRKNPNGCPITMTLYVSDEYTQYSQVQTYYERGMEIASHSVTHTDIDTPEKLRKEAGEQKNNIVTEGQVPVSDVVGWRSPNLKTAGDAQPQVLASLNYTYDISLSYSHDDATPWPFTLDYGNPYPCLIPPCPSPDSSHRGFWEVMVKSFKDPATGLPCGYVDGCRPQGEDAALEYLWFNFLKTYEAQRAPFGMNMHAAWFAFPEYMKATQRFIDRLLDLPDVYIVNVKQMLDWMRTPVTIAEAKDFKPWGCPENTHHPRSPVSSSVLKFPRAGNVPVETNSRGRDNKVNMTPVVPNGHSGRSNGPQNVLKPQPLSFQRPQTIHQNPITSRAPTSEHATRESSAGLASYGDRCIQGVNCHLPSCFCRSISPPLNKFPANIPQIVYLAIDSPIQAQTFPSLMQVFSGLRKNPNGCPISSTIFTPSRGNHPLYVSVLKAKGVQIGVKGGDFSRLSSEWQVKQKVLSEVNQANVNTLTESFGWRGFANLSPTDAVFQALSENGVGFDSSVMTGGKDQPWPYTLDFGLKDKCSTFASRCPTARYPGLWEVPITPLRFTNPHQKCFFLDTCPGLAPSEDEILKLLSNNFYLHYRGGRSPFGINLYRNWLMGENKTSFQRALIRFFDEILGRGDVVVVSIEQMLKWVAAPVSYANQFPC